jgi:hypothetical protein
MAGRVQIIGNYRSQRQLDEYVAECKRVWATIEKPNTLIILAVGSGVMEWTVAGHLKADNVIAIDPFSKSAGVMGSYTEAGQKLDTIHEPKGMVIGVNVSLQPTPEMTLLGMLEAIAVAKDWPAVVVTSPRTSISTYTLKELMEYQHKRHERFEKERKAAEEEWRQREARIQAATEEKERRLKEELGPEGYAKLLADRKTEAEESAKRAAARKLKEKKKRMQRGRLLVHFSNHSR